ncbi:3-hydroxyacyl-CoA dehydrogenase [Rhodothalassium salexigens]|nr:SDR family NAD(P)-dependent oxidoreductase [Rhodothalassium salexigens]MBK5912551.1 3-hydroxyacyl-CoA dehydrogenase [Rhodothalassium salexigens]MBK5920820.1 3-hydroxyacyl-CoA dehydrogenase [Rhodothalassium salexigens]
MSEDGTPTATDTDDRADDPGQAGLAGMHAVVTGGATGIGAAVAGRLARAGAAVTLMARNAERLAEAAEALPAAAGEVCDVTDEGGVRRAFDHAVRRFGPVAILVNNAGIAPTGPLAKISLADWQRVLDVNLTGAFLCSRAVIPAMVEAGWGRIVTIASTAGLRAYPYASAYVASKHGAVGLTRAMALELASTGVTANAVCPGYADTDIVAASVRTIVEKTGREADEALAALVKANPQKRLIDPQEVAATVMWLCSSDARSVTGQALAVAGGEVM